MANREAEKEVAAAHAARLVKNGMRVGLGSGSTSGYVIKKLGERVAQEGLNIVGIPTSSESRDLATKLGIPLLAELDGAELDIAIDGADQTTRAGEMIKGGGGALLHERIVAAAARQFVVIADSQKLVGHLSGFPLPVEVFSFALRDVARRLKALNFEPILREKNGRPFVTDEGNLILDCKFDAEIMRAPDEMSEKIRSIPGVADHGLFLGMADLIIIAHGDEVEQIKPQRAKR